MTYPITGIQKGLGPSNDPLRKVPLRREIDEWWQSSNLVDVDQKTLFILALDYFQKMDPETMLSYFQVAGIHGLPLKSWDESDQKDGGYCTHGVPLFATWHRPYVLLYEQRLYEIMTQEIIPKQFDQSLWHELQSAADTWRLPYWDWGMQKPDWHDKTNRSKFGPNVPEIITLQKVPVRGRTGGMVFVDNPMWKFTLPAGDHMGNHGIPFLEGEPFQTSQATVRWPQTDQLGDSNFEAEFVEGKHQNFDSITRSLRGYRDNFSNTLPEAVYRLVTKNYTPTYNSFASTGFAPGSPTTYTSLEDIHGSIHVFTGGTGQTRTGHMTHVPVAAFDPVFWLHHNNVERIACIWQDLHPGDGPGHWLDPNENGAGGGADPTAELWPFHSNKNGLHYTSDAIRDWRPLGYTYPGLEKWLDKNKKNGHFDEQTYMAGIRSDMDKLYSTTAHAVLQLSRHAVAAQVHLATLTRETQRPVFTALAKSAPGIVPATGGGGPTIQQPIIPQAKEVKKVVEPQAAATGHSTGSADPSIPEKWEDNDYVVNVIYEKFALGGRPFLVRIFLGDVPQGENVSFSYEHTPTQVGNVFNFSSPSNVIGTNSKGCDNCKRQEEEHALMTGQVIITDPLVEQIQRQVTHRGMQLRSLDREDVVAYLKTNLHWRITDVHDQVIPHEQIPSVKVSVAAGKATHYAEHSRLSEYRDYEVVYEVTEGRLGGASPGDNI